MQLAVPCAFRIIFYFFVLLLPDIQQYIVFAVTILLVVGLFVERLKPAVLFFGAALIFVIAGIVSVKDFLLCFSNESILSIFLLIFITAGLKDNFNLIGWLDRLFGNTDRPRTFMLRMTSGVAVISGLVNNTPLVALMIPYVYQWAKKHKVAPSRLMMSLSFAAILGGMITLIGTSTNLVLNGLITSKGDPSLRYTDFLFLGLLVTIAGVLFMYFIGYRLFPSRTDVMDELSAQRREYLVETRIPVHSHLVGKTILEAKLRNLEGVYLFEIVRENKILSPVSPEDVLYPQDSLFFAGDTENIADLIRSNNGLVLPQSDGVAWQSEGNLLETVIPVNSELIGKNLKTLHFREHYDAAVVAVHRNGEKLRGKIGEISLKAGDLLLVTAGSRFESIVYQNHNLYLVSVLNSPRKATKLQKRAFLSILFVVLALLIIGKITLFLGLLLIATVLVFSNMLSIAEIKRQLDVSLLVILAASLTFSKALIDTGAAEKIAQGFISVFSGGGSVGLLIGMFILTLVLTSFVTHVAAVSIVFPITYALCHGLGIDPVPFYVAIAFAASASFHSPFSYQTNLMVLGPGNYRFKDFLKAGFPLTFLYSVICIVFIIFYYKI